MSIAWRTDYAVRIVYELALLGENHLASVSTLCEAADVPADFGRQIAHRLARAGILTSKRGAQGGFVLARPASEITLLDVFSAVGEQPTLALCTRTLGACDRTPVCPVHKGVWLPLDMLIEKQLRGTTFAELMELGSALSDEGAE